MHLRHWILAAGLLLLSAVPARASHTLNIDIDDFFFSDPLDTVFQHQAVTWQNVGFATHTTTSNAPPVDPWDSSPLGPGATFSHTFNTVGTFIYHCNFHANMIGRVIVRPAQTKAKSQTWGGLRKSYDKPGKAAKRAK